MFSPFPSKKKVINVEKEQCLKLIHQHRLSVAKVGVVNSFDSVNPFNCA